MQWCGAALLLGVIAYAVFLGLGMSRPGVGKVADKAFYNALLLGALGLCVARAVLVPMAREAWVALALGSALFLSASVYHDVLLADLAEAPVPSVSDVLWLLSFIPYYAAVVLLIRPNVHRFSASFWLDGAVAALGLAAISAALLLSPVAAAGEGTLAEQAVNLGFPLGDTVLLILVVVMFALANGRPGRVSVLLGLGFALMAIPDSVTVIPLLQTGIETYEEGTLIDVLWPAGSAVLAFAAWQRPGDAEGDAVRGYAALALPAGFTLVALALLIYGNEAALDPVALGLATATLLAAGTRIALAFRDVLTLDETRKLAMTDELTQLANRRACYACLNRTMAGARARSLTFALLVIDLDRFKEVNDTLGHQAGDRLLEQLGPRLAAAVPEAELVARLGGDEFAVLLPPGTSTAEALETAEAVGRELEQPLPLRDLVITVQASIGIAVYPLDAVDPDTLLQRADVAMYQAKGAHSRVGVYAADRDEHSRDRLLLAEDLRRAVRSDELVLHYQPKADLPGGRVTGFEALVRWQRPGGQLLEPHEFLPLAEQTGLMPALTLRVLEQALRQCGRWADGGFELSVAVNVAAANLLDAGFPRDVADRLRASGVPADRLTLEISEDVVMADPQRTVDVLAQLGELGAHLSLDDFGTGRSSLAYIKRLPIEELKIDAGFVLGMTDDRADAAIVGSTVDLARNLGLRVVAEGVESVETWRELAALGCNVAQGFYLSRPLPAAAATRWLRRWPADEDGVGLPQPGRSPGVPRGRRAPS